jgi:hypothetical protein
MLIVLVVSLACLIACVALHYRLFLMLGIQATRNHPHQRWRVMLGIVGAIFAHLVEIGIFGAGMAFLHQLPATWNVGDLKGAQVGVTADYLYCSAMSYTTLGFEQVTPIGAIRLLVGIEALVGLVLVAWSASFTYLQMSRYWGEHPDSK